MTDDATSRILVVDDNAAGRYALAHCLRQAGHTVLEAGSARECFQALSEDTSDLILLDVKLPDSTGFEVCRRLKLNPRSASIPVIQISAHFTGKHDSIMGLESGADAYLCAPFDSRVLLAHVNALIRARKAEERLRYTLNFSPQVPWTAAPDGRIEEFSERWAKMTGVSIEEGLGHGWLKLIHKEDLEQTRKAWAHSLRTGEPYAIEHRVVMADGTHRWVHSRAFPQRRPDGTIVRWYGFSEDIQQRVDAEHALKASEARLRIATHAGGMFSWECDLSTQTIQWSDNAAEIIGCDPAELPREMAKSHFFVELEDSERIHREFEDVLEKRFARFTCAFKGREPGAARRYWRSSGCVLYDKETRPVRVIGVTQDVTESERVHKALQERDEQLQVALRAGGMGTWVWNPPRGTVFTDALHRMLWDFDENMSEVPVDLLLSRVHPDDSSNIVKGEQPASLQQPFEREFRVVRRNGEVRWLRGYAMPQRNAQGEVVAVIGVNFDITDTKLAQHKLGESESRFRTMADGLPLIVWVHDQDGEQRFVNATFCEFFGVTPDQIRGGRWKLLLHPDDSKRYLEEFEACVRDRRLFHAEARVKDADGEWRWLESWGRPRFSSTNDFLGFVGASADITNRKAVETALQESEHRFRLAKTAAKLGIYEYRPLTGDLIWDERVRELWTVGPDERVTYDTFISRVHPEDRSQTQTALDRALDPGGSGVFQANYRLWDGKQATWISAMGQVSFENGRPQKLVGTVEDITHQKEFQAELERLVARRTAKLNELVAELEHFSYSITHDMRAPLRAMRGFAEIMREQLADSADPEIKTLIRHIVTSSERMDLLITDALNYSKAVRQELPLVTVDVEDLLSGMLDTYPEFVAHRASIHLGRDLPQVVANEAGLIQCFSNLIGNALKFSEPGKSPEVTIRAERITPETGPPGTAREWVRIFVEDQGIGIPENMLPRIFNMFTRGTTAYGGTGIGLALVRKVVQRMGGRIGVLSEIGKGSRFWIDLPAAE